MALARMLPTFAIFRPDGVAKDEAEDVVLEAE
jgi:hypothetical protein